MLTTALCVEYARRQMHGLRRAELRKFETGDWQMGSMLRKMRLVLCVGVLAGSSLMGGIHARAQAPLPAAWVVAPALTGSAAGSESDRIASLEKQVAEQAAAIASAQTAGDNSWMLTSAALVLLMTGPGLALFYGGLVRKKNVLSTMMQSFAMMAVVTVLWAVVTYSLAFSSGNAFIGGLHNMFLHGVGLAPSPMRRRFRCRRSWCTS